MDDNRAIAFLPNRHPSDGALASISRGRAGDRGGGVAIMIPTSPHLQPPTGVSERQNDLHHVFSMMPTTVSSHNNPVSALNLSTYTAGEDAGRLAMLAKELGLARMRPPKPQIRKHAFKAFLRNHSDNLNEDILQQQSDIDKVREDKASPTSSNLSSSTTSNVSLPKRQPPLRFIFSGYSLWLELEQKDIDRNGQGDLDRAMIDAADRFNLGGAIPSPHVTALYGIDTIADEEEMRRIFREDVKRVISDEAEKRMVRRKTELIGRNDEHDRDIDVDVAGKLWPDLDATGIICDVEFDGVKGGTMDMAWAEVSLSTSPDHEMLITALYDIFYRRYTNKGESSSHDSNHEEKKDEYIPRSGPWVPHLSLCYDNPEGFGPNLSRSLIAKFMREKCPTLECILDLDDSEEGVKFSRAVSGISLWRTTGTMAEWKCLDRFEFP